MVQVDGDEITLMTWPAWTSSDHHEIFGDLTEGSVVLIQGCSKRASSITINKVYVIHQFDGKVLSTQEVESARNKITICHRPLENSENAHTITVIEPAVEVHLKNHGDSIGTCP